MAQNSTTGTAVSVIPTVTKTVTNTITSTYQVLCTASPHGKNTASLMTEPPICIESPSLIALGLFLGLFIVLFVIVTAGWVWTIVWTVKKKELGEEATLEQAARGIATSCCLRVKENPAYGEQSRAPQNDMATKLNLKLDCNPAYESSTMNLDKDTDSEVPDPAYELIHYSTERKRLESKAHEYEMPDVAMSRATLSGGNIGTTASDEKNCIRERSKSDTEALERTYAMIQN